MIKILKILLIFLSISLYANAQQERNLEWNKASAKIIQTNIFVETDSEGFIYYAGNVYIGQNRLDWYITKLNPRGDTLYSRTLGGSGGGDDLINGLNIDNEDRIYLYGSVALDNSETAAKIIRLDVEGNLIWELETENGYGINEFKDLKLDSNHNLLLAGNKNKDIQSDVFLKKLDSNGNQIFSYSLEAEYNTEVSEVAIQDDARYFVAFNTTFNNTIDIGWILVDEFGSLEVYDYFKPQSLPIEKVNSVTIDNEGNIYLTGFIQFQNNKDFLTIRLNALAEVKWYAQFDDNGYDDEAYFIKILDNNILVSGDVDINSNGMTRDVVSILYNKEGIQLWKQKFSSESDANDQLKDLIIGLDDEIILSIVSEVDLNNQSGYILKYNKNGEFIWGLPLEDSTKRSNSCSKLVEDFLGNIYLGSEVLDSLPITYLLKINQPEKANEILINNLKTLTQGFVAASSNESLKNVIYSSFEQVVDQFYAINIPELIAKCTIAEYNLLYQMNVLISEFRETPYKDYVTPILKQFWVGGNQIKPFLAVPHFIHFAPDVLDQNPKLAYSLHERNYPVPCLNCENQELTKETSEAFLSWIIILGPQPWYYINGDPTIHITPCTAKIQPFIEDRCKVCTPVAAQQVPQGPAQGGQAHEIEINLNYRDILGINNDNMCYESFSLTDKAHRIGIANDFAVLSKTNYTPYWYYKVSTQSPMTIATIEKVDHPIFDREYYYDITNTYFHYPDSDPYPQNPNTLRGDVLNLCLNSNLFNSLDELNQRFGLAFGIYKLSRPGINQKPVYFNNIYVPGLWYSIGPDLGINYGL